MKNSGTGLLSKSLLGNPIIVFIAFVGANVALRESWTFKALSAERLTVVDAREKLDLLTLLERSMECSPLYLNMGNPPPELDGIVYVIAVKALLQQENLLSLG